MIELTIQTFYYLNIEQDGKKKNESSRWNQEIRNHASSEEKPKTGKFGKIRGILCLIMN